jgi:capsular polysaccharide transport system ATP-binding protein
MTIELHNVTKRVRDGAVKVTYEGLNLRVEKGARTAFLGNKSAGLDAIVSLICGADAPDRGSVSRTHSISWPIPDSKFMSSHLSIAANARFIARLYEQDEAAFLKKVADMSDVGEFMNVLGNACPKEVLSRFCFSVGVCLDFDCYLLTGVNVGAKAERERYAEIAEELGRRAGILFVGSDVKSATRLCEQAYVFDEGRATYFDDMEAAAEYFGGIASGGGEDEEFFDTDPELKDMVGMDF